MKIEYDPTHNSFCFRNSEAGSTKISFCDLEKYFCDGASKRERPKGIENQTTVTRYGIDGLNISLPGNASERYRVELKRFSKKADGKILNDTALGASFLVVDGLNIGTKYYVGVRRVVDGLLGRESVSRLLRRTFSFFYFLSFSNPLLDYI